MLSTKGVFVAVAVAVVTAIGAWRWQASSKNDNAGSSSTGSSASSSDVHEDADDGTAVLRKILEGGRDLPRPTSVQLHAYVEAHGHDAPCLLAAWRISGERSWLEEAAHRHPDNPRVALAMVASMEQSDMKADEWIARLKQADPSNGLPWCYEASRAFQAGSLEAARAALTHAAQSARLDDYTRESAADGAQAYRAAGYKGAAAEGLGNVFVTVARPIALAQLAHHALESAGDRPDDGLVQDILAISKAMHSNGGPASLVNDLVGLTMERKVLDQLYAFELIPGTHELVAQRLSELDAQRSILRDVTRKAKPLLPTMSESEWKQYLRRVKVEGELKAMTWLIQQRPTTN